MNVKDLYLNQMKNNFHNPKNIQKMMSIGLGVELYRSKIINKTEAPALRYLNEISLRFMRSALKNPEKSVWVNLFAPCEIMHAFDLLPLAIENYASFLSGFKIQNLYLEEANHLGLSDTLCSYHKAFIGAAESGIAPIPIFAAATSIICDANNSTFGYLANQNKIPYYLLDIPHVKNDITIQYVKNQLEELIESLEKATGQVFDMDKLQEIIEMENKTLKCINEMTALLKDKHYPKTMTHEMYMLAVAYIYMGRKEVFDFYQKMNMDLKESPSRKKKRLLWVHVMPFSFQHFKKIFGPDSQFEVVAMELNFPNRVLLEGSDPLTLLSEKMIDNQYNGSYERKVSKVINLAETLDVDGVIHFCHLGCRQNAGGSVLLKKALKEKGIPFLAIDGDGLDMRKNQEGQLVTRVEAFLELI